MKFLSQFNNFNIEAFLDGKRIIATGLSEWTDRESGKHLGTVVEGVIYTDNTVYKQKEGEHLSNRFEKLKFKVNKDITVPMDATIVPVNPVATVYGEYRNNLSIKCDDIKVLQPKRA